MDPFEAIADPVRRRLLEQLAGGPARVVDLAAEHAVSRPAISKHLRLLGEAGLVTAEDRGRERHYRLAADGLAPVRRWLGELDERAPRRPAPPVPEAALDGLELEVRRTTRERSDTRRAPSTPQEETA
ncbi:ArsR family transcriptional regulator [Nocardioides sp. J9]|uniref:ArsR/SmtB family transcription factor n=1 Tax=unclassified Nocardioides TaxID=2615069 RepID=UPI00048EE4E1|nr:MULTISPECIES: metalloregulator ArsR/SmtB family transcription factor [unclassified Nocardioides]TWH01507.1 ArsR family transcriptional regulator [Nocardioides sp. J9]